MKLTDSVQNLINGVLRFQKKKEKEILQNVFGLSPLIQLVLGLIENNVSYNL